MPTYLIWPTTAMTLAFAFYTLGVWAERFARDLRGWHVIAFWLGLSFDAYGTYLMEQMTTGGMNSGWFHTLTGFSAFALMALHAGWATWVVRRGAPEQRANFHRYSVAVWTLWLVPYLGGMIAGMIAGAGK
ncbi:MAG: HsmA family protein [Actinomycetota bacterium]|nr:HsmA family protein [Actinomycetota bacterium]